VNLTAADIARALHGRRSGNRWMARCPAHDDRTPSLGITESDGKVLVCCYAGCAQADVIAALRARGLWPERERPEWRPAGHARWAAQQQEARRICTEAAYFADAARQMAEWELQVLPATDPDRAELTSVLSALRVSPEAEYRAWLKHQPEWAGALVHAGRERERRLARMILAFVTAEVAHAA
jgi:hypothetical protein